MVRRCAVIGCGNTDEGVLSFQFPEDLEMAAKWKETLRLPEFPIELLQTKFSVCETHFHSEDIVTETTKTLKPAAIPNLLPCRSPSPDEDSDGNANHRSLQVPAVTTIAEQTLQRSCHSQASTNNEDICILEAHESHYDHRSHDDDRSMNGGTFDFTVLDAPQRKSSLTTCGVDESTEVLLVVTSESQGRAFSGTDSDVEVLMSEEIVDSEWSASAADHDGFFSPHCHGGTDGQEDVKLRRISDDITHSSSMSVRRQESATDHDVSVEEFSRSASLAAFEALNRSQLLNVISNQAAHIRLLEASLKRYESAQQTLFEHVDALRLACTSSDVRADCVQSNETLN